ncbi:MAG: histidine--tRNA ligase [Anaerolineaceae bacterium]|nr:MAG: histidine--tRNA ligase [Anaerolineaceae bacterium]
MITQRPRGTQDWYGKDMYKRTIIEEIARKLCKSYHIKEIITPVFEHTILFQRGVGETTDVVQKEMYTFQDKGNRSITLKPEGTAGAVRAYLENSLYAESQPTKLFYITQAFRYENPQSGRLRQHHQFGVEIFGSASPLAEIEIISLLTEFMEELGLKGVKLYINSIGCKNCRKTYNEALLDFLNEHANELCGTCKERMQKNPLRVLDCKVPTCQEIIKDAPRTIDYLDEECKGHFEELQNLLKEMDISYQVDTGIVRGLDYYTRTVFEFINSEGLTLCGGGRYDNLVNEIEEKQDIPAVGFGFGIERIIKELDAEGVELATEPAVDLYVGILGKESRAAAYRLVKSLRKSGLIVETDYMDRSVKAQMKYANKIGAKNTVIIGADELAAGKVNVKNMDTGNQIEVDLESIGSIL